MHALVHMCLCMVTHCLGSNCASGRDERCKGREKTIKASSISSLHQEQRWCVPNKDRWGFVVTIIRQCTYMQMGFVPRRKEDLLFINFLLITELQDIIAAQYYSKIRHSYLLEKFFVMYI